MSILGPCGCEACDCKPVAPLWNLWDRDATIPIVFPCDCPWLVERGSTEPPTRKAHRVGCPEADL